MVALCLMLLVGSLLSFVMGYVVGYWEAVDRRDADEGAEADADGPGLPGATVVRLDDYRRKEHR